MQTEMRKSTRTMITPTKIPTTTHSRRPNIEVGFESSVFMNALSYIDILVLNREAEEHVYVS